MLYGIRERVSSVGFLPTIVQVYLLTVTFVDRDLDDLDPLATHHVHEH